MPYVYATRVPKRFDIAEIRINKKKIGLYDMGHVGVPGAKMAKL
jgi:hypothetical protein